MTSERDLSIYFFRYPCASTRRLKFARHSSNVVFEKFFSKQSFCFAFDKVSFYPRRVAPGKMGILKSFGHHVVSFDVQDGFFYESLSFERHCVKESYFLL